MINVPSTTSTTLMLHPELPMATMIDAPNITKLRGWFGETIFYNDFAKKINSLDKFDWGE